MYGASIVEVAPLYGGALPTKGTMPYDDVTPRDRDPKREGGFRVGVSERASWEHPDRIEDAHLSMPERGLFAVFDGMSKPRGGEEAATEARRVVKQLLAYDPDSVSEHDVKRLIEVSFAEVHDSLRKTMELNPELQGIGTTATVVKFINTEEGQKKAVIGNVGDSRAYVVRTGGKLEQITLDDNGSLENLEEHWARLLQAKFSDCTDTDVLDPNQFQRFMERNRLTNLIGGKKGHTPQPKMHTIGIGPGERIVLLSDGVSDNLTDREIERVLQDHINPDEASASLIDAADARSREEESHPRAKPDDMTAIVIEVPI